MKLGVYLETVYCKQNQYLFCKDIYTILLNRIATDFDINYIGHVSPDLSSGMYQVKLYNKLYELSSYKNLVSLCLKYPFYRILNHRIICDFVRQMDCLLIMAPSPISLEIVRLAIKYDKKIVLLIRQDTRFVIPLRYRGIKKIFAQMLANWWENKLEIFVQNNNLSVLGLGYVITERYKHFSSNVSCFVSSRYKDCDIVLPKNVKNINFDGVVKLLFVGRVEINKGIIELLKVLSDFDGFKFHLTIVGDGNFMSEVKKWILKVNLSQNVTCQGYLAFGPQLMNIYREHDIFILPSYSEGLPQVILEAMANGCLVLSTSVGSVPYIIQHGKNGFLFEAKDVNSLKSVLDGLKNHNDIQMIRYNGINTAKMYAFEKQMLVLENKLLE